MVHPVGVGISGNTLWVANASPVTLLQAWTLGGSFLENLTGGGGGGFSNLTCAGAGKDGPIYVGMNSPGEIFEFSPTGAYVTSFGSAQLSSGLPLGVAANASYVFVTTGSPGFLRFTVSGSGFARSFSSPVTLGGGGPNAVSDGEGIDLDQQGNVYVGDYGSHGRIVKYDFSGNYQMAVTLASAGGPQAVAVDGQGYILAGDGKNLVIQMFDSSGNPVTQFGAGCFSSIYGMCLDLSENLYLADYLQSQVTVFKRN